MRARASPAADGAPQALRRGGSGGVSPLPPPRPSSSRNDDHAASLDDLADLNGTHAPGGAGSHPSFSVRGRHPDEKATRGLRIQNQGAQSVIYLIEANLRAIVEIGPVPFEATEADPNLGVSTRAGKERHEARTDPQADRRLLGHLVCVTGQAEPGDIGGSMQLGVDGSLRRGAVE